MEKSSFEMDFEEWELVPDSNRTFLNFGLGSEKGLLFSKVDINYFNYPSEPSKIFQVSNEKSSSPVTNKREESPIVDEFEGIGLAPPSSPSPPPLLSMLIADNRDVASKVFFKKLNNDEFVDMKVESPKGNTKGLVMPQIEPEPILFDHEEEEEEEEDKFYKDERSSEKEKDYVEAEMKEGFGLKIWRWRLVGGVGALCSIGVAAATMCIFILGGRQQHQHQNQKIQFQIYADEKRIKQVVQQATRLNQAISAVRGVPVTSAHISFGGYYDGL